MKLDEMDRRILRALQRSGRLHNNELAKEVGLSPSPCLRRVKLLEEAGVIDRYVAVLNAAKVDQGLTVFVRVWLQKQDAETVNRFTRAIMQLPQVVECHLMAGDCDFLLRIVVSNLEQYRQFQTDNLGQIEGIQNMKTEIPMQLIKQTLELPILGEAAPCSQADSQPTIRAGSVSRSKSSAPITPNASAASRRVLPSAWALSATSAACS